VVKGGSLASLEHMSDKHESTLLHLPEMKIDRVIALADGSFYPVFVCVQMVSVDRRISRCVRLSAKGARSACPQEKVEGEERHGEEEKRKENRQEKREKGRRGQKEREKKKEREERRREKEERKRKREETNAV